MFDKYLLDEYDISALGHVDKKILGTADDNEGGVEMSAD